MMKEVEVRDRRRKYLILFLGLAILLAILVGVYRLTPTPMPTCTPAPSTITDVEITKIFYDGFELRTEADEYVEIKNLGCDPVDLEDWVIKDISEGYPSLTFPSYMLQPGERIRVYTNEIHPEYGGFSFCSGKAVWNNNNPDTAVLYDAQGQEVSRKSY
jgi:hypothetical protein